MASSHEEKLTSAWRWPGPGPGPQTDPVGMDYIIRELDPMLRTQLVAVRMEAVAATYGHVAEVYRAIGEGAAKAAEVVRGGVRGK